MPGGIIYALIILALVLFILEIFLPSGILGLIGLGLIIMAIFLSAGSIVQGIIYVTLLLVALGFLVYFSLRFPRTRKFWQRLTLRDRQLTETGYTAPYSMYKDYVGKTGRTLTKLRPAGIGDFDGERLDIVSEGEFIDEGVEVKIIAVEGTRIIVRKV